MDTFILGLDLGISHAVMARSSPRGPLILGDAAGRSLIPMMVTTTLDGEPVVGRAAQILTHHDPENRLELLMLLLGRRLDDPLLQTRLGLFTCQLEMDAFGEGSVLLHGNRYSPVRAAACLLEQLRQTAEINSVETVHLMVLAHPGWFEQSQKQALLDAARFSRIENVRLVDRFTACAAGAGLLHGKKPAAVCIIHLDGSEVEAAILEISAMETKVLARAGEIRLRPGVENLSPDPIAFDNDLTPSLRRELVNMSRDAVLKVMMDADMKPSRLAGVVMGGMGARLPSLQQEMRRLFGHRLQTVRQEPEYLAARGAVSWVQAVTAAESEPASRDAHETRPVALNCPYCGELNEGTEETCWFCHQPLFRIQHPGILPSPLGIQVEDDRMAVILKHGVELPTLHPALGIYQTSREVRDRLAIPIYSGFHNLASRNDFLGILELVLSKPIPAATEVVVGIIANQDGTLHAAAWLQVDPHLRGNAVLTWHEKKPAVTLPPPPPLISVMQRVPPDPNSFQIN